MTATHVPVLAGELIELLDPQPGEIAVDCTFGGGGHARARRRAASARAGSLIAIDRDPAAEERFAALADEVAVPLALHPRATSPTALEQLRDEGVAADLVYLDLGMSSMQVDTWERGFSYAYDAPLDMRMDPEQELTAADIVNDVGRAPARAPVARVRRGALRAADRARDRARAARARPLETTNELVDVISARVPAPRAVRRRPSGQARRSRRSGSRSTTSSPSSTRALPRAWELLRAGRPICRNFVPFARRPPREALPRRPRAGLHLPARPAGLRLRARAGGRAAHPPLGRADARRGRRQPARRVRPGCAPHASSRTRPHDARRAATPPRAAPPARRRRRAAAPAAPRLRPRPPRRGAPRAPRRAPAPRRRAAARAAPRRARGAARSPTRRFLDRLLRGRAWIALVGVGLMGIVFHPGLACCKLNAGISRAVDERAETLERQNATLRATSRSSTRATASRDAAAKLGHDHAAPGERHLPRRAQADGRRAAARDPRAEAGAGAVAARAAAATAAHDRGGGDRRRRVAAGAATAAPSAASRDDATATAPAPATPHRRQTAGGDRLAATATAATRPTAPPDAATPRPDRDRDHAAAPPARRRPQRRRHADRRRPGSGDEGRAVALSTAASACSSPLPGAAGPRRRPRRLARRRSRAAAHARAPHSSSRGSSVPARRGSIIDRKGIELAVSQPAADVSATRTWSRTRRRPRSSRRSSAGPRTTGQAARAPRHRLRLPRPRAARPRAARRSSARASPASTSRRGHRRFYPQDCSPSQLLGTVGTDGHGLSGLEYSRDALLDGRDGGAASSGRARPADPRPRPAAGPARRATCELTIDADDPGEVERVLADVGQHVPAQGRDRDRHRPAHRRRPRAGQLAARQRQRLRRRAGLRPQNRAVGATYEPGSTFKAFTVAGALEEGVVTPETDVHARAADPGRRPHDRRVARARRRDAHDRADPRAVQQRRRDHDRPAARASSASTSGCGASASASRRASTCPARSAGIVLPLDKYSGSSMGNLPIGQGISVTPMQMAAAYGAIANGGMLRRAARRRAGRRRPSPRPGRRVISAQTARQRARDAEGVVAPGGTAEEVAIPGYELAGKTGTANKPDPTTGGYSKRATSPRSSASPRPATRRLLIAVMVDEPQGASTAAVAAPAFQKIARSRCPTWDPAAVRRGSPGPRLDWRGHDAPRGAGRCRARPRRRDLRARLRQPRGSRPGTLFFCVPGLHARRPRLRARRGRARGGRARRRAAARAGRARGRRAASARRWRPAAARFYGDPTRRAARRRRHRHERQDDDRLPRARAARGRGPRSAACSGR